MQWGEPSTVTLHRYMPQQALNAACHIYPRPCLCDKSISVRQGHIASYHVPLPPCRAELADYVDSLVQEVQAEVALMVEIEDGDVFVMGDALFRDLEAAFRSRLKKAYQKREDALAAAAEEGDEEREERRRQEAQRDKVRACGLACKCGVCGGWVLAPFCRTRTACKRRCRTSELPWPLHQCTCMEMQFSCPTPSFSMRDLLCRRPLAAFSAAHKHA